MACACTKRVTGIVLISIGLFIVVVGLAIGLLLPRVVQQTVETAVVCPQSTSDDCFFRWSTNDESIRPIVGSEHDPTRQYNDVYMFNITNKAAAMAGAPMDLRQIGPYRYRLVYQYYNVKWDYAVDTITYKEFRQMIPDDPSDPLGPMITQLSPTALRATYLGLMTFINALALPQASLNPASSCYNLTDVDTSGLDVREWNSTYRRKLFCRKEIRQKLYPLMLADPTVQGALARYGGDFFVSLGSFLPPIVGGLLGELGPQLMASAKALFVAGAPTLIVGAFVQLATMADANALKTAMFVNEIVPLFTADMTELAKGNVSVAGRIDLMKPSCGNNPQTFNPNDPACAAGIAQVYAASNMAPITVACTRASTKPSQYQFCGLPGFAPADDLQTNQQCCLNQIRTNEPLVRTLRDAALPVAIAASGLFDATASAKLLTSLNARAFNTTRAGAYISMVPYGFAPLPAAAEALFASRVVDFRAGQPPICCAGFDSAAFAAAYFGADYVGDDAGLAKAEGFLISFVVQAFRAAFPTGLLAAVQTDQGSGAVTWDSLLDATPARFNVPRLLAYQLGTGWLTEVTTYAASMAATGTSINNATYNMGFLAHPMVRSIIANTRNPARPAGVRYLPFPPSFMQFELGLRQLSGLNFDANGEGLLKVYSVYNALMSSNAAMLVPEIGKYLAALVTPGADVAAATARVVGVWAAKTGYTVRAAEVLPFFKAVHEYLYTDLTPILRDWLHAGPGREFGLYMTRPVSDWARGMKSDIYEAAVHVGWCNPGFLTHHTGKSITWDATHKPLAPNEQGGCIMPSEGGDDAAVNGQPNTNEYSYFTGKQDMSKIWQYAGIGKSTRTATTATGEPQWRFVSAWYYPAVAAQPDAAGLLRIQGHAGSQFMPAKKTFEMHDKTKPRVPEVNVFVTQANRFLNLNYEGNFKVLGITLNKFVADRDILRKDHRYNPHFFEPISINGTLQIVDGLQTTEDSRGFPSWISRPLFAYGDRRLLAPFPALVAQLATDGETAYDTYLGVEPITGATMSGRKRLQGNIGVLPGMFSAYNVYNGIVGPAHMQMPIPYYWVNEHADIAEPAADAFKTQVYTTSEAAYGILIALPIVGLLVTILGTFLVVTAGRTLGNTESQAAFLKEGGGFEVQNPIYTK